ncbi:MAG: hypothetical protein ABRQ37_18335, partial [Candidatus Eremiobacterota bacterium]
KALLQCGSFTEYGGTYHWYSSEYCSSRRYNCPALYDLRGKPTDFSRGIVDGAGKSKVILKNLEKDGKEMLYSGRR